MKKEWIITFTIFCILFLVSCSSPQGRVGEVPADADTLSLVEEEILVSEEIGLEEAPIEVDSEDDPSELTATSQDAIPAEQVDECVKCHINKQSLIDTAKPLEVVEPENEGEG